MLLAEGCITFSASIPCTPREVGAPGPSARAGGAFCFPMLSHPRFLMADDIENSVYSIIEEKLGVDESEISRDASFTDDLGADSLDTVELIMEFEKEFDITIPDEEAEDIQTVGDAVDYLENKTAEA